jgi:hypothetical protein
MTVTEIATKHDVSRQTIHTYRRTGIFPSPVEGEGSTRLRFREDEVAAFFKANPKQPRKKRRLQGEPVTTTVDPRTEILSDLCHPEWNPVSESHGMSHDDAVSLVDAYRSAVLREAADKLDESETLRDLTDDHMHDVNAAANELRRMADEPEAQNG